jgi:hypothetical protein
MHSCICIRTRTEYEREDMGLTGDRDGYRWTSAACPPVLLGGKRRGERMRREVGAVGRPKNSSSGWWRGRRVCGTVFSFSLTGALSRP